MDDLRKLCVVIAAILIAILPVGILLAYAHEENPAVPTLPGIEFSYETGIGVQGSVTVNYIGGSSRTYRFNTLNMPGQMAVYDPSDPNTPVDSVTINEALIQSYIATDDPSATCTISLSWVLKWTASATGQTTVLEDRSSSVSLSYATTQKSTPTFTYVLYPNVLFPATPTEGQNSKLTVECTATGTITFSGTGKNIPAPFTDTATGKAEVTFTYNYDYYYEGGVRVSMGDVGGGGLPSLLPMRGLSLDVSEGKTLTIAWQYVALEIVGIVLLGYAVLSQKE